MHLYFEITHEFRGNNCLHKIDVRRSIDDIRYKHNIVSTCNSDEYREFGNDGVESDCYFNSDFKDLYEYEYTPGEDAVADELFMVFSFYEYTINIMNIYTDLIDAKKCFNRMVSEIHMRPVYDEISVLESDKLSNRVFTLYHKNDGQYTLPDKAKRVVLQKINITSGDTIQV